MQARSSDAAAWSEGFARTSRRAQSTLQLRDGEARAPGHPQDRGAALLRARPRADAPLLRRQARLRRDRRVAARSSSARGGRRSAVFQAGDVDCSSSTSPSARAGAPGATCASTPRASARSCSRSRTSTATFRLLDERGGTLITDVAALHATTAARWRCSRSPRRSATPPSASSSARGYRALFPGLRRRTPRRSGGSNRFGFERVDHVTSNFQTMKPALLWMEHVLGFEQLWEIAFHTERRGDRRGASHGSGLKSIVMWDPASRREVRQQRAVPARSSRSRRSTSSPRTTAATACSTSALAVGDIVGAVRGLRARGRRVHADAGQLLRRAARAARADRRRRHRREHRRPARARDPGRRRASRDSTCCRSS